MRINFIKKLLLLCTVTFLLNAAFASEGDICEKYFNGKNYKNAFGSCEKACQEKDGEGCTNLGLMYHAGLGVRQNTQKAKNYYEKACNLKNGSGCSNLGYMYYMGQISSRDFKKAKIYYEKACNELNNHLGCLNLGNLYYMGHGVKQSYKQAKKFIKKGCDLKLPEACAALKQIDNEVDCISENDVRACYQSGEYFYNKLEFGNAKKFFRKACELGDENGCFAYGLIVQAGG